MPIPQKGTPPADLLRRLQELKSMDPPWRSGKVLAFNYTPSEEAEQLTRDAFSLYLSENALDPTTIRSVHKLETEVIRIIADLLRGGENAVGNFTSGGTESILLAVKTYRDRARALKPHIKEPEMILPYTAHGAFLKAARYFDVKAVLVQFDPNTYQVDMEAVKAAISPNTILMVGSAPAYAQGVVDPISELSELAVANDIGLHVDGCVGGIQLSFMRDMGYRVPDFDFSLPGVTSISADLHKYGYAPKGASSITWRDKSYRQHQIFSQAVSTTYALVNATILSSRSGGPVAAAWAILNHLGREGYEAMIREVQEATETMMDGINATGDLHVLGKPDMCMFSFASDTLNVFQLSDDMAKHGWYLQPQFSTAWSPPNLHIAMTLGNVAVVEDFLKDLRLSIDRVKASKNKLDFGMVKTQVEMLLKNAPGDPFDALAAMAGLGQGGGLPSEMALLNTVMDVLPKEMTERLLVSFWNDLYV